MTNPSNRSGLAVSAAALMITVVVAIGCGSGPESPTVPALSSGGGDSSSGGSNGDGGTGGGDGGTGGGGGGTDGGGGGTDGGGGGTDGGGGGTGGGGGSTSGSLVVLLTDNPVDEISELNVFIESLKVKPDGAPVERFASTIGLVDLLTLQNGVTELLGQGEVEAGTFQFIELLLDEDQSYVVEVASGEQKPLKIASEKIKIKGGPFDVLADGTTSVLVDFDAEKSLKKTGNGRYQLKAFVSIMTVTSE